MESSSIFETTFFTRKTVAAYSPFIKAMHPNTSVRPDRGVIKRILAVGWVGQAKILGHRAQIHIPCEVDKPLVIYNRKAALHAPLLPIAVESEIRRVFTPLKGWNVIDTEWIKGNNHLYVFDFLKYNDILLYHYNYIERYERLPRVYGSACIQTLPLLRTLEHCMAVLTNPDPYIEGLVFKAAKSPGFRDTSIVRCRKIDLALLY